MATLGNYNLNKDDEKDPSVAPTIKSGTSNFTAAIGAKQQPGKPAASGSKFTNINKYLEANKGNRLGGTIASNIDESTGKLKSDTDTENAGFQTAAGKVPSFSSEDLSSISAGTYNIADQANQDRVKAAQNASFAPTGLSSNLGQATSNVGTLGANTGTESGRFELLNKYFKNPTSTKGGMGLNQLLLQTDPTQANAVTQAGIRAKDQAGVSINAMNNAASQASALQGQTQATKSALAKALQTGSGTFDTILNNANTQASTQDTNATNFIAALNSGDLDTANSLAAGLGIDPSTYMSSQGGVNRNLIGNAGQYYNYSGGTANTRENTFTPEQVAQYNAYQNLLGTPENAITHTGGDTNSSVTYGGNLASDFVAPTGADIPSASGLGSRPGSSSTPVTKAPSGSDAYQYTDSSGKKYPVAFRGTPGMGNSGWYYTLPNGGSVKAPNQDYYNSL